MHVACRVLEWLTRLQLQEVNVTTEPRYVTMLYESISITMAREETCERQQQLPTRL